MSDGTAAGTLPLRHVCRGACSEPVSFVPLGGSAYLGVKDADGPALWRTDGTAEGTVLLARVALPSYQPEGALVGDQALLGVSDATRISELWATDGSPAGTRRVRTFARSASSSLPSFLSFGDGVLFTAQIGPGVGWWRSDGSSTRKLRDLCSPCYFSSQQVAVGGLAYTLGGYPENSGLVSPHLFRTDGTQEGTREILALGSDFSARTPFAFAGKLFFLRCGTADAEPGTNLHKCGIWASDGTPEGTGPRIVSLPATNYFSTLVVGDTLYFSLFGRHGTSIYQSDGTEAGTRRVARFIPYTYAPSEMAVAGGRVFVDAEGSLGVLDASAPDGVRFLPGGYVIGLRELGGRLLFFASSGRTPARRGSGAPTARRKGPGSWRPSSPSRSVPTPSSARRSGPPSASAWSSAAGTRSTASSPGSPTALPRGPGCWAISRPALPRPYPAPWSWRGTVSGSPRTMARTDGSCG